MSLNVIPMITRCPKHICCKSLIRTQQHHPYSISLRHLLFQTRGIY